MLDVLNMHALAEVNLQKATAHISPGWTLSLVTVPSTYSCTRGRPMDPCPAAWNKKPEHIEF